MLSPQVRILHETSRRANPVQLPELPPRAVIFARDITRPDRDWYLVDIGGSPRTGAFAYARINPHVCARRATTQFIKNSIHREQSVFIRAPARGSFSSRFSRASSSSASSPSSASPSKLHYLSFLCVRLSGQEMHHLLPRLERSQASGPPRARTRGRSSALTERCVSILVCQPVCFRRYDRVALPYRSTISFVLRLAFAPEITSIRCTQQQNLLDYHRPIQCIFNLNVDLIDL